MRSVSIYVMESEKRGFDVKTSFRKFITKENKRNRHMWSEMAMGTSWNEKMGGLVLNQGLANLLSFAGSMHESPRMVETIRANILRWVVTEGLAEAATNRKKLAQIINKRIEDLSQEEVPMTQKPGAQIPIVQPGLRPAVGEAYVHETIRVKTGTHDVNYGKHRDVPLVHDVDVFSPIARQEIFEELGELARGINPEQFWKEYDDMWLTKFEPRSIPVRVSGYEEATLSIPKINKILIGRGFEPFVYGTPSGYIQYVEKGDYLPRSRQMHTDDPNQQHGPDLSEFDRFKNQHGEEVVDFKNIAVPDNLVAYGRVLAPMQRNFAALAAGIKSGRIKPEQLGSQYQQIAQSVSGGEFDFADAPKFNTSADASLHTFGLKKGDKKEFPASLIPKLAEAVKAGLAGPFTMSPDGLAAMVKGTSHVTPTGTSDRYGQHFTVSQEVQDKMFQQIFAGVPQEVLAGQVEDDQVEIQITPRLAWKATLSSFTDKDPKGIAALKPGQRWELKKVIGNAFDIDPKLVSPDMVAHLKDSPNPSEFLTKSKQEVHELTPEMVDELSRKGYKFDGRRIPYEYDLVCQMIDQMGGRITVTKGTDNLELANEKGKYIIKLRTPGDEPFTMPFDAKRKVSHLLGGVQLGQAQGRGHIEAFPMRHYEDQTRFIDQLKGGMYGEPEGSARHGHELASVVKGVRAARNNATKSGKVRGVLITDELMNKLIGSPEEMVWSYGEEALRALSGNRAMKWGFISDEDFRDNKGWDVEKDLEREASKDFEEGGKGGRSLKSRIFAIMGESPDDTDLRRFVDELVEDMDNLVHSGQDITPEALNIQDPQLAERIMKAVGENAFWSRVTLIRRYVLNKIMKDLNVLANQDRSTAASQLGGGDEETSSADYAGGRSDDEERDDSKRTADDEEYEGGYFRPDAAGEVRDIAPRVRKIKQQKELPVSGPPAQATGGGGINYGKAFDVQQAGQPATPQAPPPPREATPDMSHRGAFVMPEPEEGEGRKKIDWGKAFGESTNFPSYKSWKETYAVFDPKMAKPKKGAGFNWWGTPGNSGGTEIGGEVETANSDPDGTKGSKNGRKKRAS